MVAHEFHLLWTKVYKSLHADLCADKMFGPFGQIAKGIKTEFYSKSICSLVKSQKLC